MSEGEQQRQGAEGRGEVEKEKEEVRRVLKQDAKQQGMVLRLTV